ncbi:MAG: GNAT family N-acetyltransferase [Firmicutes bacterium]|nr:GNAT family N-acetyltransferase [Bacillota bacterium]
MDIVRDAQARLAECGVPQWQDGYPDEAAFLGDIARSEGWVFLHKDEIVGICTVSMRPEEDYANLLFGGEWLISGENYGVVHRIAVRGDFRHTALAGEMLDFSEELSRGLGRTSLRVDTHAENNTMRGFLKKHGYRRCGTIKLSRSTESDPFRVAFEKLL